MLLQLRDLFSSCWLLRVLVQFSVLTIRLTGSLCRLTPPLFPKSLPSCHDQYRAGYCSELLPSLQTTSQNAADNRGELVDKIVPEFFLKDLGLWENVQLKEKDPSHLMNLLGHDILQLVSINNTYSLDLNCY